MHHAAAEARPSRGSYPTVSDVNPGSHDTTEPEVDLVSRRITWCVDHGTHLKAMSTFDLWLALSRGDIPGTTRVWRVGRECWGPACDVPELACALQALEYAKSAEDLDNGEDVELEPFAKADDLVSSAAIDADDDDTDDEVQASGIRDRGTLGYTIMPPSFGAADLTSIIAQISSDTMIDGLAPAGDVDDEEDDRPTLLVVAPTTLAAPDAPSPDAEETFSPLEHAIVGAAMAASEELASDTQAPSATPAPVAHHVDVPKREHAHRAPASSFVRRAGWSAAVAVAAALLAIVPAIRNSDTEPAPAAPSAGDAIDPMAVEDVLVSSLAPLADAPVLDAPAADAPMTEAGANESLSVHPVAPMSGAGEDEAARAPQAVAETESRAVAKSAPRPRKATAQPGKIRPAIKGAKKPAPPAKRSTSNGRKGSR